MKIKELIDTVKSTLVRLWRTAAGSARPSGAEKGRFGPKETQLFLYIVIIILINVVSLTLNSRCDLTRNRTYSLSHKSREIVSNLKENMKIKVLFSKDLPPQHTSIYRYLIDILEEYNYYANEYFSYEIVGEKDLEKQAADYGIRPVQSQEFDSDQVKVRRTYMALVIQQSDVVEKIEAITDPTGLEYSITSMIEKMTSKIDGLLGLKEPIQVILYLGGTLKNLPIEGIDDLAGKVREAVDKCNTSNYDKLRLQVVDPSEDKAAAVSADLYGVAKLNWKAGAGRNGTPIPAGEAFMGIVMKNRDKSQIIELSVGQTILGKNVITGLDKLQDRINNTVGSLVSANPRIGYITGHDEPNLNDQQSPQGGAVMKQLLSDVYDITFINLANEEIPSDLGLIIINGPRKEFTGRELYKIDQFLMKGKSAVFFVDSFNEINLGQQNMFSRQPMVLPINTGLDPLLRSYGAIINKDIVLDESCAKAPVAGTVKEVYYVPIIKKSGLNQESVITRYLKGLALLKASSVSADPAKVKERKLTSADLVNSSEESWLMTGQINFNPFFLTPPEEKGQMKKYALAVLLSGKFESYFKGKDVPPAAAPADAKDKKAPETFMVQKLDGTVQAGTSKIIVVGTSEITRSGFLMNSKRIMSSAVSDRDDGERVFSNGLFIHGMADYLLGNSYIPEMSSKSLDYNPLNKIGDPQKIIYKTINIGGVPIFVVLAGLFIWKRRQRRKKGIQDQFAGGDRHE